jgi:hypothetical protein
MTINEVSNAIFTELASCSKPVAVHSENNVLIVKVGEADTRIMNWQAMSVSAILDIAKSLVLKENYKGNVLLHG